MLTQKNYMKLEFPARSVNEGFARAAVAAFAAQLDPTLAEIGDIKTAVSEAVTNAVVHAYPDKLGTVQAGKSAAAWALRSWRALWTRCGSSPCPAAARP